VTGIPDGQLFWIVRYGSHGTAMPPSKELTDDQIWQVVAYMRQLARP
jgi:mono/diheme cytochrome c family protein